MIRITKTVAAILLLATLCGSLMGCGVVWHGAKIYSKVNDLVLQSFSEENKVYGARYQDPSYVEGSETSEWYRDDTAPESRSYIVADLETYNAIFKEGAFDIDFEKEMLLLCTFSDVYQRRYFVDRVSVKDGKAEVYIRIKEVPPGVGDACMPYQRWLAVKIRKTNVSSVEFFEWDFDVYNGGRYEKI